MVFIFTLKILDREEPRKRVEFSFQHIRRRPFEFRLGKFNVLPGLEFAVRTMQRREKAKFIMSSDLLYGEQGSFVSSRH